MAELEDLQRWVKKQRTEVRGRARTLPELSDFAQGVLGAYDTVDEQIDAMLAATPSQQEQPRPRCRDCGEPKGAYHKALCERRGNPIRQVWTEDCQPEPPAPEHVGEGWPAEVRVAVDAYGTPFTVGAGEEDEYDTRRYVPEPAPGGDER